MTEANANNARPQVQGEFRTVSGGDTDPRAALLAAATIHAGALLARAMDGLAGASDLPAPQMPHTFAAALGDVSATAAADPEMGEAFRAGLSLEDFAGVLAHQVRANFLMSAERIAKRLEAAGASTYQELHDIEQAREEARAH